MTDSSENFWWLINNSVVLVEQTNEEYNFNCLKVAVPKHQLCYIICATLRSLGIRAP